MNTYEQQLKEILNPKGCGKIRIERVDYKNDSDGKDYIICDKDKLCPTCKAIQQAKKETLLMCVKDELEFLKSDNEQLCSHCHKPNWLDNRGNFYLRISQLQEVIKKLEEIK